MRVARRLYWKQVADGMYGRDNRALLDDFFRFFRVLHAMALLADAKISAAGCLGAR
jgi:hypothetical protein